MAAALPRRMDHEPRVGAGGAQKGVRAPPRARRRPTPWVSRPLKVESTALMTTTL